MQRRTLFAIPPQSRLFCPLSVMVLPFIATRTHDRMTLFLHIGMQKTGTTSLQISMAAARPALAKAGLLYPSGTLGLDLEPTNAHHYLAHAMMGHRFDHTPQADLDLVEAHCAHLTAAAAGFAGDTILSSEDLSRMPPAAIPRLRALLPAETKVMVYLRRQDYWVDSLYGQSLKFGPGQGLEAFLEQIAPRLDYAALLAAWADSFGPENIVVRAYERRARRDLWADFCVAIRQPQARKALSRPRRDNVSLTRQQIELLDAAPDAEIRRGLRRLLERHNQRRGNQPDLLRHLPAARAADILAGQAENNRAVAQRFLARDALFADQAPPCEDIGPPEDLTPIRALLAEAGAETDAETGKALLEAIRAALHRQETPGGDSA